MALARLAEYAQHYFEPSATQEILDEVLPKFSLHFVSDALTAQAYLIYFLPTTTRKHSITHAPLDAVSLPPNTYLPTLFSLWTLLTASPTYDMQFADFMARVAEANIADPTTVEVGIFTQSQIKFMYTVTLRMMNLPVGSQGREGGGNSGSTGVGSLGVKTDVLAGRALFLRKKTVSHLA